MLGVGVVGCHGVVVVVMVVVVAVLCKRGKAYRRVTCVCVGVCVGACVCVCVCVMKQGFFPQRSLAI